MYFGEEAWRHLITGSRCRPAAALFLTVAERCRFRIIRLFLTLKATAPAATYGLRRSAYLMAPWRRPTEANARFTGMRSLPGKRHLPSLKTGCRKARSMLRVISMFPSKARSQRRLVAAFVP